MDGIIDWDLYAIVNGICPATDASSSSFVAAISTISTTTTTTPKMLLNNGQMLDENSDSNLDAMVGDFYPAIDSSSSSLAAIIPATTTTFIPTTTPPKLHVDNNQMLDENTDWNLYSVVDGFNSIIDSSSSSLAPIITSTATTSPKITENNGQMLGANSNWSLDAMLDSLYPNVATSSDISATTTTTRHIPTNTTTPIIHLNNGQMLDECFGWNLHAMVNGFSPTIATSSPSIPVTTTLPITSTTNIPMDIYDPQNLRFREEMSNNLQSTNGNNTIIQLMEISNNPLNFPNKHKHPLTSTNWPILSLPCFGEIHEPPNHQGQQNQLQGRQPALHIFAGTSKSKKRKRDMQRIYKMPPQGLNTDVWSWKKYGEKYVGGSPHPRIYYKCDSTSDCEAKRRVERNILNPNSLVMTYIGQHNHPMPMNYALNKTISNPISSKNISLAATESFKKKKNDEDGFEGLENFVNL